MPPIGPQYDPEQIRAVNTHDIVQRQQPPTPGTWIALIILVVVGIGWVTLLVTRAHHTSVMPAESVTSSTAAPRFATPAP